MAFSFPVPNLDFIRAFKVEKASFDLEDYEDVQGTGFGEMDVAQLAWPKWIANVTFGPVDMDISRIMRAKMRRIGSQNLFYISDTERKFPLYDPTGAILGNRLVRVLATSGRTMQLRDLPGGYVLGWGDLVQVPLGQGRNLLVEVADSVVAGPGGTTPPFEVNPGLPEDNIIGLSVVLKYPCALMRFRSRAIGETIGRITSGVTIQAVESF